MAALALAAVATPAAAQGHRAAVKDFAWLVGSWEGHLPNIPGAAESTFFPGTDAIIGVTRLVDASGKVFLIELSSLTNSPLGVVLRFRHFSPELDAYEATFRQVLQLNSMDSTHAKFENTVPLDTAVLSTRTRGATWTREGPDAFLVASNVVDEHGTPSTAEVTYRRTHE